MKPILGSIVALITLHPDGSVDYDTLPLVDWQHRRRHQLHRRGWHHRRIAHRFG